MARSLHVSAVQMSLAVNAYVLTLTVLPLLALPAFVRLRAGDGAVVSGHGASPQPEA
ncbi:MAG: hypothetical protein PHO64_05175 [Thiomonas sp.]|nr:hypothetical protein [Thiomonas sp.]